MDPRTKRLRTAGLALLASTVLVLAGGEIALRWLLFGEGPRARRLGHGLRQPSWYATSFDDDDYWKLHARFSAELVRARPGLDPVLGWTGSIEPGTYAHPDEALVGDRRPVLVYGDSYAECVTPPAECWQGLVERSELGRGHALLNYGVGGYGLDQVALMLERSLGRFDGREPIVLIGVLVDDDLERCALTYRDWPKPRFRLEDGRLALDAPGPAPAPEWLAEHPPEIPSYVLRLLGRAFGPRAGFAYGWTDETTLAERRALCRAILARIVGALDAHGVERRAFVLFQGELTLAGAPRALWQEELVRAFAAEHGIPCHATRPYLEAALDGDPGRLPELLTTHASFQGGHYDAVGNRIAFEAFRAALLDQPVAAGVERVRAAVRAGELRRPAETSLRFRVLGRTGSWRARCEHPAVRVHETEGGPARLSVRPGADGRTEVELDVRGARRLSARVRAVAPPGSACGGEPLVLSVTGSSPDAGADGPSRSELALGAPESALSIELDGQRLAFTVERAGPLPECAWLVLDALAIE